MQAQNTSIILMIRPAFFGYNPQTAESNSFQENLSESISKIQENAKVQFDKMVVTLQKEGVNVLVFDDKPELKNYDAIFSNNWVTYHADGRVVLYPMFAPSRRNEIRLDIVEELKENFVVKEVIDWSNIAQEDKFLEATGSMVMDYPNKIVYACFSIRTHKDLLEKFAQTFDYELVTFTAKDVQGLEIYHTNVLMCIGEKFAIICLDAIPNLEERTKVVTKLQELDKTLISISTKQMENFAGNMLEIKNSQQENLLIASKRAVESLTEKQKEQITQFARLIPVAIPTIETYGGGSARCMITEVFLPLRSENN